ncbi:MAG: CarD family transcriptional regulator, partial [Oscillospiraceae bacterium]|nr:CarD family transcriptional regulator [Oscillospiraceae bacterium]
FKMPLSGLVLKIPTHNCTAIGIRPIRSASEIEDVICSIPAIDATMTVNWNHRYQENMQRLKTGDLRDVALVIKGLTLRDRERGLSTGERKMLHSAKQVLLSEVVLAQNIAYQDAEARLNSIMSNKE